MRSQLLDWLLGAMRKLICDRGPRNQPQMRPFLILADPADLLAAEAERDLVRRGKTVWRISEDALFSQTRLALHQQGSVLAGDVWIRRRKIAVESIAGVLLRLPQAWWPPTDLDLSDQMFVYHETMAAWFSLLARVRGLVVNRFGLGWWLRDPEYQISLCQSFARQMNIPMFGDSSSLRPEEICSAYLASGHLLFTSPNANSVRDMLDPEAAGLTAWSKATGIELCRLDFVASSRLELLFVDAFPLMQDEALGVARRVAASIGEAFCDSRHWIEQ